MMSKMTTMMRMTTMAGAATLRGPDVQTARHRSPRQEPEKARRLAALRSSVGASRFGLEPYAEPLEDAQHGRELGIAAFGERSVKRLARQAGLAGELAHAERASHDTDRIEDEGWVASSRAASI
jgi:hypothetical protein